MDLSEARIELRNRGFTDLTDSRANTFLNAGKNAFEDMYAWPWLEAVATGVSPLSITDVKSVLMVSDTSNRNVLVGMDRAQILHLDPSLSDTSSPPVYWYLSGTSTLTTWPASSGVNLSALYIKFSPELSADSDEPLIPERNHDVWIDFAAVEAYHDNDEFEAANTLLSVAQSRAVALVNVYCGRNLQNPMLYLPTFASEDW